MRIGYWSSRGVLLPENGIGRVLKSRSNKRFGAGRRIFLIFIILVTATMIWLWYCGEGFFSLSRPISADVLIVEGWIGSDGIRAAAEEFKRGAYKYVVATGGLTVEPMADDHSSYAEIAKKELLKSGIAEESIIVGSIREIERERTFKSAVATWQALQRRGVHPRAINVLTLGPHARRSRLVYEKVYAPDVQVGVIAFVPPWYRSQPWWLSRARTKCLLKEVVGYPFELFFNSGRVSSSAETMRSKWVWAKACI
jgi:hypothetical protein